MSWPDALAAIRGPRTGSVLEPSSLGSGHAVRGSCELGSCWQQVEDLGSQNCAPQIRYPSGKAVRVVSPLAAYFALGLTVLVVIAVWVLACKWVRSSDRPDYFTWFLLHFGIGTVGIGAVLALALLGHLSSGATTAILSSIVAYSLGAAGHNSPKTAPPDKPAPGGAPADQTPAQGK